MKSFWNATKPFLIPAIILWLFLTVVLLLTHKADLHLIINKWNFPFTDVFFSYYTHVGGALFLLLVWVALFFYRYSAAIFLLLSEFFTFLIIYPAKHLFGVDRPLLLFENKGVLLHQLDEFILKNSLSFPSGHSGAAFALFLSLTVLVKPPVVKFLFFIMAALVAFSRVYLSQHFTEDVFAGSVIGCLGTCVAYLLFYNRLDKDSPLNKSIL